MAAVVLVGGLAAPAVAEGGTGFVEVCKTAAEDSPGLVGDPFTFTVQDGDDAEPRPASEEPVPASAHDEDWVSCSPALEVLAGEVTVTEDLVAGTDVSAIDVRNTETWTPDEESRSVVVDVAAGTDVLVLFENQEVDEGVVEICKRLAEDEYSQSLAGLAEFPYTVTVGDGAPQEFSVTPDATTEDDKVMCTPPIAVPADTEITVVEGQAEGYPTSVTAIDFYNAATSDPSPETRTATLTVAAAHDALVVFTNAGIPPQPDDGILKVCKAVPEGTTATAEFDFTVDGSAIPSLDPGECSADLEVASGQYSVRELAEAGWTLQSVTSTTFPGATEQSLTPTDGAVTVDVGGGETVVVTFTNAPVPPQPDNGCTLTQGFWKNHPEAVEDALENGAVMLGGESLTAEEIEDLLTTSGGSNYWYKLAHQLVAAQLNLLASDGGTAPEEVADAIAAAQHFFATDADGPDKPSDTVTHDGQTYTLSELNSILTAFNEGTYEGWPHCDSQ